MSTCPGCGIPTRAEQATPLPGGRLQMSPCGCVVPAYAVAGQAGP